MNGDQGGQGGWESYTPLEKIFHIIATVSGRPDIIPGMKRQGMEDLYRQMQMKKWQEQEQRGKQPLTDYITPAQPGGFDAGEYAKTGVSPTAPAMTMDQIRGLTPEQTAEAERGSGKYVLGPGDTSIPAESEMAAAGRPVDKSKLPYLREATPERLNFAGKTLADIPAISQIIAMLKKEEQPLHGFDPTHDIYRGGTLIKPGVREDVIQSSSRPWQDEESKTWITHTHKSGKVETVPVQAPGGVQIKGKKPTGKLQHVSEDRGDAIRKGTYDAENGTYKWEEWTPKKPAPVKPEKPQRISAQYDSWEKTIDRRFKQIGTKYKLSQSELENIDVSGPDALKDLTDLFQTKGLGPKVAQQYLKELADLNETRTGGLQDIENGKDPYPRLKGIGTSLPEKKEVKTQGKVSTLPQGSKEIGTYQGKKVYETPDGERFVEE